MLNTKYKWNWVSSFQEKVLNVQLIANARRTIDEGQIDPWQ